MAGEFYFICEGKDCRAKPEVTALPRCPKCRLSAMLCERCMDQHDCKAAKDDAAAREREPD